MGLFGLKNLTTCVRYSTVTSLRAFQSFEKSYGVSSCEPPSGLSRLCRHYCFVRGARGGVVVTNRQVVASIPDCVIGIFQ